MSDLTAVDQIKLSPRELWVVSVPELGSLTSNLQKVGLSDAVNMSTFNVPDLRVGTLDQLIGLSDDLNRVENMSDGLARKLCSYFADVALDTGSGRDNSNLQPDAVMRVQENLKLNQGKHNLHEYIRTFNWDQAKFPSRGTPLADIMVTISEKLSTIDSQLKQKSVQFNSIRRELSIANKKQTGSILTRELSSIVDEKRDLVTNSEYLTTLLVAVNASNRESWIKSYERLSDYVVPRSSKEIYKDQEYSLFTVTLFQRTVDEFKTNCQKNRFIIRDFQTTDDLKNNNVESLSKTINRLQQDQKKMQPPLVRWLKVNYTECITMMMHLKCLKIFIESVLRYGLPVRFESIVIQPPEKAKSKLNSVLDMTYKHLDRSGSSFNKNSDDVEGIGAGVVSHLSQEYRPYVFSTISCDYLHTALGL